MSKKITQGLMADLQRQMAADVPPVLAKMQAAPPPTAAVEPAAKPSPRPRKSGKATMAAAAADKGARTAVYLSPAAVAAMRRLQGMLFAEQVSASASSVMSLALELAGVELGKDKMRLTELYAEFSQRDKRRRPD